MITEEEPVVPTEYSEAALKHFLNPVNVGEIANADGIATVGDPNCGDFIKVWIKVDNEVITDFKYKIFGCGAAIATSSAVSELAIGKTLAQASQLTDDDVVVLLGGLPENKKHCSLLAIRGLHTALADYLIKANHHKYRQRVQEYLRMGYDMEGSRARIVQRLATLPLDSKILEIGTGKGHLAIAIAKSGRTCTSVDLSPQEQHFARLNAIYFGVDERIKMYIQDARHLAFGDNCFDAVISVAALHHIEDTPAVLQEMVRVCKAGGRLLIADFNAMGLDIVGRMHQKEGKEHKVLGWDLATIQQWFASAHIPLQMSQDECLWILDGNKP